jgi:outer membrane protein assembly factor BamB
MNRFISVGLGIAVMSSSLAAADWPGFRGDGTSVSTARDLPLHWSATSNMAWRVTLPGTGQSSPIIWRDRVYVTSAVGPRKEHLVVQALSLDTGKELWRFTTNSSRAQEVSNMHSQAAPTPVAADDGVFAFFESGDGFALTHEGSARWHHTLAKSAGEGTGNHGLGGSPVLFERGLFLPLDQQGPACLLALDRTSGAMLWKTARPDRVGWSTPVVARRGDEWQIIASGTGTAAGYDPETGALRWEVSGILKNTVPSPTVAGSLLVIGSGSKGSNLALDLAAGPKPPTELWRSTDATCGFASPLIHRGRVYFLSKAGVLTCLEARSGRRLFEERVNDGGWASPIGAGDRIYVFGEKTSTTILAATDAFRPLATNELNFSKTVCGVAATDGALIFRAYEELVCLGKPPSAKSATK